MERELYEQDNRVSLSSTEVEEQLPEQVNPTQVFWPLKKRLGMTGPQLLGRKNPGLSLRTPHNTDIFGDGFGRLLEKLCEITLS